RASGPFRLEEKAMGEARKLFGSGRIDDKETLDVIRRIYEQHQYIVDPHTAVGLGVAEAFQREHADSLVVSLATAHPAKFPAAVNEAIGITPALPPDLADLYERKENYAVMPVDAEQIKDFVKRNANK